MEENLLDEVHPPIYKHSAAALATFFGGPLAGGFIIADNFKRLGHPEKVKATWLWTGIALIADLLLAFFLPEQIPGIILPLSFVVLANTLVKQFQGVEISNHNGEYLSNWRAVLVGIVGLVISLIIIIVALLIAEPEYLRQIFNP